MYIYVYTGVHDVFPTELSQINAEARQVEVKLDAPHPFQPGHKYTCIYVYMYMGAYALGVYIHIFITYINYHTCTYIHR